jgi:hypothetical protein
MPTKNTKTKARQTAKAVGSGPLVRYLWAVMKAHAWSSLTVAGIEMTSPAEGPQRFIPVFETREQAVAWAGSEEHVVLLST